MPRYRVRAPHERRRRAHVDASRRTRCCESRSPRWSCSTGRPTASASRDSIERASRLVPRLRQRVRRQPACRSRRPAGRSTPTSTSTTTCAGCEPAATGTTARRARHGRAHRHAGLRPGPAAVGVHGRRGPGRRPRRADHEDPPRHHRRRRRREDAMELLRPRARRRRPGPMPDAPEVDVLEPASTASSTRSSHERPPPGSASPSARSVPSRRPRPRPRRRPGRRRHGCARDGGVASAACSRPATEPLSPLMTGRSLSVHFDTLVRSARRRSRRRPRSATASSTTPSWPASPAGSRRYHDQPRRRRRRAAHDDADQRPHRRPPQDVAGNQFVPARFPVPVGDRRSRSSA